MVPLPAPPSATADSGPASLLYLKDMEDDLPELVVLTTSDGAAPRPPSVTANSGPASLLYLKYTVDDLPVLIVVTTGDGAAIRPAQRHR